MIELFVNEWKRYGREGKTSYCRAGNGEPYAHAPLPQPTVGEQTEPERNQLIEWLRERRENCLLIAEGKTGDDLRGWIEDSSYFGEAIRLISPSPTPIPVGEKAKPEITAKDLIAYLYTDDMVEEGPFHNKHLQNILDWMEREPKEASNVKN